MYCSHPIKLRANSAEDRELKKWMPLPAGDHLRVTLRFEAEGKAWTLDKTSGRAGAAFRLHADGAAALANSDAVQVELQRLLRLNVATWGEVLFTKQAQLARTVAQLAVNGGSLDDVHALMKGAAAIPGDIPAERLLNTLEERIADHSAAGICAPRRPGWKGHHEPLEEQAGPGGGGLLCEGDAAHATRGSGAP